VDEIGNAECSSRWAPALVVAEAVDLTYSRQLK
jgi:hypothetical protein